MESPDKDTSGGSDILGSVASTKTPVSILHEVCTQQELMLRYDLIQIEGSVHAPTFKYQVTVQDQVAVGFGNSKMKAKQCAAQSMIENLKNLATTGNSAPALSEAVTKLAEVIPALGALSLTPKGTQEIDGNPIGELQAFCLGLEIEPPTYTVTKEEGPPHNRYFEMVCYLNKQLNRIGSGKTKKHAKKESAFKLWSIVKIMPLEEFKLSFTKEEKLAKTNPPDLEVVNPTLIQDLQEAVNGKVNSNLSQDQQLDRFCRNLNFNRGNSATLQILQNHEKFKSILDRNGTEQFLFELAKELGFEVSFGKNGDVTSEGRFLSVVQVGADPIIVCVGSAASSELAKMESCKNALEYIRLLANLLEQTLSMGVCD